MPTSALGGFFGSPAQNAFYKEYDRQRGLRQQSDMYDALRYGLPSHTRTTRPINRAESVGWSKEKTFREALQSEIDKWLKD